MSERTYTRIIEAADVTDEVLSVAEDAEGWFVDQPIDWEDFLDRMDGHELADGTLIDMGESIDSPAIRKIKKHISNYRKEGS